MKKTAIVTDLKVVDSPQAGLGTSRCLKEAGFNIIGVDDTPLVTSNKELFEKVFCWEEIRNLNFDSLIKKIIDVKKNYGLNYIFPCYDETLILFSFIKDKLDYLSIELIAPPKETLKAIQKTNLCNIIENNGDYKTPKTKIVNSNKDALKFAKSVGYPVVCKGRVKGAYICENEDDLIQNIKRISNIWTKGEISCLIQKYVDGKYENCIVAIDQNKIVGYVEMTKIGVDQNGATWFGKIKKTKNLFNFAEYLIKSFPFDTSIIEIETINNGDNYYVYEINPRPPAWIYAACQLGVNLPELLVKKIHNIKFMKEEGYFGRETRDFIRKDIDEFEENLKFYSKGVAYKSGSLKYPSELL